MNFIKHLLGLESERNAEPAYRMKDGNYIQRGAICCRFGIEYSGFITILDPEHKHIKTIEIGYSLYKTPLCNIARYPLDTFVGYETLQLKDWNIFTQKDQQQIVSRFFEDNKEYINNLINHASKTKPKTHLLGYVHGKLKTIHTYSGDVMNEVIEQEEETHKTPLFVVHTGPLVTIEPETEI
ncbi:MAG: hypothetical protein V1870_04225 [Candidatus Aenigmatarchaeota archaeon]